MYEHGELTRAWDWEYEKDNCIYSDPTEIRKLNIKGIERWYLMDLSCCIETDENVVMIDGTIPSFEQLSKKLKVSRNTLSKYIKILTKNKSIITIKHGKRTKICINPNLYFVRAVTIQTYNLFKNN